MNPKYLYLTINLLSVLFPLLFSFHPKANFSKKWKYLSVAIIIPAIVFIVWDDAFTEIGVWGFNPNYLSGIYVGSLPLEEILFFICIPYACVFTYESITYLVKKDYVGRSERIISIIIIILCLVTSALHVDKWYTCSTFLALGVYLIVLQFSKPAFMGRFYFSYLLILFPFFIVNGILTGSFLDDPVVWYNDAENLGIRIHTIPIEDLFYALLLIMMNVSIFEWLQVKHRYLQGGRSA